MMQIAHIQKNKQNLLLRAKIMQSVREFFLTQDFLEADTPIFLRLPDTAPYLNPVPLNIQNEKKQILNGFLHTSPEFTLKKMLAAGFSKIFALTHCFRDQESFGGTHNPEFTMLEWYRTNENFYKIMDDCENLFNFIRQKTNAKIQGINNEVPWEKVHMRDLWQKYVGVNLDEFLTNEKMSELCQKLGFNSTKDEPFEDLFYKIFLNKIEPFLGKTTPTIVHHYPKQMAALAQISETDPLYAERFEIYIQGIELANAYSELTNVDEQEKRLKEDLLFRKQHNLPTFEIDQEFVEAVGMLPKCAGIALGVDRLIMLFANTQNIDDVLVLPMSKI